MKIILSIVVGFVIYQFIANMRMMDKIGELEDKIKELKKINL